MQSRITMVRVTAAAAAATEGAEGTKRASQRLATREGKTELPADSPRRNHGTGNFQIKFPPPDADGNRRKRAVDRPTTSSGLCRGRASPPIDGPGSGTSRHRHDKWGVLRCIALLRRIEIWSRENCLGTIQIYLAERESSCRENSIDIQRVFSNVFELNNFQKRFCKISFIMLDYFEVRKHEIKEEGNSPLYIF